jgi:hypothetical protein
MPRFLPSAGVSNQICDQQAFMSSRLRCFQHLSLTTSPAALARLSSLPQIAAQQQQIKELNQELNAIGVGDETAGGGGGPDGGKDGLLNAEPSGTSTLADKKRKVIDRLKAKVREHACMHPYLSIITGSQSLILSYP